MRFGLLTQKEYVLKSCCTRAEIVNMLSNNIMQEPVRLEYGLFTEIVDEQVGKRKYFEGVVNDCDFSIHYKMYRRDASPDIYGVITEVKNGVEIRVRFTPKVPLLILSVSYLILLIILIRFVLPYPTEMLVFFIVVSIVGLLASILNYKFRIMEDIKQLLVIFKAEIMTN